MKLVPLFVSALCLLTFHSGAYAQRATADVKTTTDKVLAILSNPKLQEDSQKAERREQLRAELDKRFDWAASARSCLGRHWAKRTPAEQKEFIRLFSQFLEATYLEKFEVYYDQLDKIDYTGEKLVDNFASVKVVVTTKEKIAHPVEYRLQKSPAGDDWKVYDVVIEGASLVKNYRDQFDEIIAKSSYEGLIKDIKSKQGVQ